MKERKKSNKLNFYSCTRFVFQFMKHLRIQLLMFYLGWLFDTIAGIVSPILFGLMINQIVYYKNLDLFIKIGLVFFFLALFGCVMYYLIYELYSYIWKELNFNVRMKLFHQMQRVTAEEMANQNYGNILVMVRWWTMDCVHFVVRDIVHNINNYIRILTSMIVIYLINPMLALVMLVMVPVSVQISMKYGKKVREEQKKNSDTYGEYVGWLFEVIGAFKEIRLLGAEKRIKELFQKNQDVLIDTNIHAGVATIMAEQWMSLSNTILQMMLFSALTYLAIYQNLSIGSVVVVLTYFGNLTRSFKNVSSNYMNAQSRIATIQHIYDFIQKPTEDAWKGTNSLEDTKGNIEMDDITFAYQEKEAVINGFRLSVNQGEKIAIVGTSGCGKTTLAYMLIGFYRTQTGVIKIDGKPIEDYSLESIYKNIGVVQQDTLIFNGSIRENITLGNPNASDNDIMNACRAAGIYDFIMEMEDGLDTILGFDGRKLSGGQKQRLSIARVYLKNPKIIIFDEATSSLDHDSEVKIHDAWKQVLKGRTSIIIAHRLSSVMLCDKVAIMEDGMVIETGKPSEMEKLSCKFQELFAIKGRQPC